MQLNWHGPVLQRFDVITKDATITPIRQGDWRSKWSDRFCCKQWQDGLNVIGCTMSVQKLPRTVGRYACGTAIGRPYEFFDELWVVARHKLQHLASVRRHKRSDIH